MTYIDFKSSHRVDYMKVILVNLYLNLNLIFYTSIGDEEFDFDPIIIGHGEDSAYKDDSIKDGST